MDRHRLATWSLALDDEGFAQACAALGVLSALAQRGRPARMAWTLGGGDAGLDAARIEDAVRSLHAARDEDGIVLWQMPSAVMLARLPAAAELAEAWRRYLADAPWGTRIAVRSRGRSWRDVLPMLRILQHPAVAAGGVFVADAFAADGAVDWALPFRFATLADDPLAAAFTGFRANWRQPWPYRFVVADRAQPKVEILVFSASLRRAAGQLLRSVAPSRAALALVLGGVEGDGEVERLARVVAGELGADGVVCVSRPEGIDVDGMMRALVQLGDELTHNRPLDMALAQAFGGLALALLNRDLLRLSHMSHAVERIAGRLEALPNDASLAVSERSLGNLIHDRAVIDELNEAPEQARDAVMPTRGGLRSISPRVLARNIGASRSVYRYFRESDEASSLAEVSAEVASLESARAADAPETRYVQHSFWRKEADRLVEERQRLTVGVAVLLRVRIGPLDAHWQSAPEAFPAHELPRSERRHHLQIVFHEPAQLDAPLSGELWLPRSGPSSVAEFVFTPRSAAAFEGRITVLHRGRVLQTVLIHTRVQAPGEPADGEGISQQVEARVRAHWSDLDTRRRFDASFVLNHTHEARPMLTGVSGKRAWATDLSGIQEPIDTINQLLSEVAHSVADYSQGLTRGDNLALFYKLARVGSDLYSALVMDNLQQLVSGGMNVDEATHIQIVSTRADAVVPFEFIYQYLPPDDENDVRFCPNALEALATGACPDNCAGQKDPQRHVCPMGFWGLRKVIERHIHSPGVGKPGDAEVLVQAEPAGDRRRLQIDQAALVGYSAEVTPAEVVPVMDLLRAHLKGKVHEVKDWDEWKASVSADHPTLLVAFPHNTGDKQNVALEIGGTPRKTLRLPREYVHVDGPWPLVLLLGCDVASTAQQYANHIRYFRQAGAGVVVSTIATVFGPHAVKVGEKLLAGLLAVQAQPAAAPGADDQRCLGEVLRTVKRQALLVDSLPMALCVVAFGDADWRL